jgi:hypothetical protein
LPKKYTFIKLGDGGGYGVLLGDRKDCWRETGYIFFSKTEPVVEVRRDSPRLLVDSPHNHMPEAFDLEEIKELLEDPDPSLANYF